MSDTPERGTEPSVQTVWGITDLATHTCVLGDFDTREEASEFLRNLPNRDTFEVVEVVYETRQAIVPE